MLIKEIVFLVCFMTIHSNDYQQGTQGAMGNQLTFADIQIPENI